MRYATLALENLGEGRFNGPRPGDKFRPFDPEGFEIEAESISQALEALFEIGNLDTPDANGKVWPHKTRRSLSVGDMAFITALEPFAGFETPEMEAILVEAGAYVCDRVGWVEFGEYRHRTEALLNADHLPVN